MSSIRVVCRFRPQNKIELAQGGCSIIDVSDNQTVNIKGSESNHTFTFDRIYDERNSQKDVYDDAAKPVIEDIMLGYNGTIFVYGQTSSGKTHTMQGPSIDDAELKGVIPRMINTVFECINKADQNVEFIVKASYIEIYMEKIRDLLDVRKDNLRVREEKGKGVWVEGTTEVYIYREEDILEVMRTGQANRAIAETKMNAESSRSHSIFILSIQQKNLKEGSNKHGKLYLVDLAGSEKVAKTGAQGLTLDEAKMINKSLSSLGNVINSLTDGKSAHIPYRDSKLTRVLQESLGGNSRTTLIINCSPSSYNEVETVSTLRFGNRAKNIKNKAKINQERSAAELKILLAKAEKEIESLKEYTKELESLTGVPSSKSILVTSSFTHPLTNQSIIEFGNNNDSNTSADMQQLKEKCISLEKLLFQKEEERKELLDQMDSSLIQLHDKEQELEVQAHLYIAMQHETTKLSSISQENETLTSQVTELKLSLEKKKYEAMEQSLLIEELNGEIAILKSDAPKTVSAKGSGVTSPIGIAGKPTIAIEIDPASSYNKEWAEKEEQLKLLQRTPSKPKHMSLSLSPLEVENNELKNKLVSLELIIEEMKMSNNNNKEDHDQDPSVADDDDDETASSMDEKSEDLLQALEEGPSEMILQAEQLKKLLNENSDQKNSLDQVRAENKRLLAKLSSTEEEMRLRMEEELNMLREQTNEKLQEFYSLKEHLLRDLENRCQKVIDLELMLDESQDKNVQLVERLKRTGGKSSDQELSFIQMKLDEMTSKKHQLSMDNNKLKLEIQRSTKQLAFKNEHISNLEVAIKESQDRQNKLNQTYISWRRRMRR
uniref:Kinesin-like protein n=1 Tax=Acytostelium subglobosum TaxID=361139 RepID=N0DNH1_ACYSU|nr:ADB2008819 [Acytostelium subglobosum]